LYHTTELLQTMARACPDLLAWTTVCAIDDPGPDTASAIAGWLDEYDGIQIAARVAPGELPPEQARRVFPIGASPPISNEVHFLTGFFFSYQQPTAVNHDNLAGAVTLLHQE